jgi:hypothetical protein
MVVSESSVGEVGDNIPSSSDEEGCIDMMRVENKRCQVSDAFALHGSLGATAPPATASKSHPKSGN